MKTLLIIPAYNEAESLPLLLEELQEYPQYDSLVINDCSQDATSELAKMYPNVICIDLPVNLGLSGAVQTGFLYAIKQNYDICIQIDGDGQHIPAEIDKLVQKIKNGADISIGSRFLTTSTKYKQSFFRSIGAKYITGLIKLFSGVVLTDPTSGMRAFHRIVFSQMALSTNERPEPDTILSYARQGKKIEEVQVDMRERLAGESYLTLSRSIKYMVENTLSFIYVVLRTKRIRK